MVSVPGTRPQRLTFGDTERIVPISTAAKFRNTAAYIHRSGRAPSHLANCRSKTTGLIVFQDSQSLSWRIDKRPSKPHSTAQRTTIRPTRVRNRVILAVSMGEGSGNGESEILRKASGTRTTVISHSPSRDRRIQVNATSDLLPTGGEECPGKRDNSKNTHQFLVIPGDRNRPRITQSDDNKGHLARQQHRRTLALPDPICYKTY